MDFAEDGEGTKDNFAFLVYFLKIQAPTNSCLHSNHLLCDGLLEPMGYIWLCKNMDRSSNMCVGRNETQTLWLQSPAILGKKVESFPLQVTQIMVFTCWWMCAKSFHRPGNPHMKPDHELATDWKWGTAASWSTPRSCCSILPSHLHYLSSTFLKLFSFKQKQAL